MKRSECTAAQWREYERVRKAAWRKAHPDRDAAVRASERSLRAAREGRVYMSRAERAALKPAPVTPVPTWVQRERGYPDPFDIAPLNDAPVYRDEDDF